MTPEYYTPKKLVLMPSRKCPLKCDHCVVEAGPGITETAPDWLKDRGRLGDLLFSAVSNGFDSVSIYGGEPFALKRELLLQLVKDVRLFRLPITIDSNGFWGRDRSQAAETLRQLSDLCKNGRASLAVSLSVDAFHQPAVPVEAIANIICEYRKGDYSHNLLLGMMTFTGSEHVQVLEQLFDKCCEQGVYLLPIPNSDKNTLYPALEEELIEFTEANFFQILGKLNHDHAVPLYADANLVLRAIDAREIMSGDVVKYSLPLRNGKKAGCIVFTDPNYYIQRTFTKRPIYAGRGQKGESFELCRDWAEGKQHLILGPDDKAFAVPAQLTKNIGVITVKPDESLEAIIAWVDWELREMGVLATSNSENRDWVENQLSQDW